MNSEIGRTEYLLVSLIAGDEGQPPSAYPMGKGSGSVTTFSRADGFITIPRHDELIDAGTSVEVQRLGRDLQLADLVVLGSHCVGLDFMMSRLQDEGWKTKFLAVGSTAGLEAAKRNECDIAGIHLFDPQTGQYNTPWLTDEIELMEGYQRKQGLLHRVGDERFAGREPRQAIRDASQDPRCVMVNRNRGSGTRILIDQLLEGHQAAGYGVQSRNHNAVAAAIKQGRADWGIANAGVAEISGLAFHS